ncbi:hypothetical protein A359_05930 [secondary endosymbiont of Ctenarytaina eucalypti]|uniref:Uncharacterized protein n=1 Tax=secondary endosymbiont of Ctenarytaina eucalypti TaxID=1199245 RepID=J3Z403_9ENTR|nr:hypothetical protein A359_05930 [secondary endosymbiont of Ctenarytaina eucalypti]
MIVAESPLFCSKRYYYCFSGAIFKSILTLVVNFRDHLDPNNGGGLSGHFFLTKHYACHAVQYILADVLWEAIKNYIRCVFLRFCYRIDYSSLLNNPMHLS